MQATCLSAEALHDIKAMLGERGNPESGWLFVGTTRSKDEQLEVRSINDAMKSLAEKTFGAEKAKEFKTKALRSFYNSALLRASVQPQEIKDLMMGHARQSARKKYDYDEETIVENYKRGFEYLGINGIQTRTDVAKLKIEFDATKNQLLKIVADQHNELEEVKGYIKFLKDSINVADLSDFKEWLESKRKEEAQQADNKAKAEILKDEKAHFEKLNTELEERRKKLSGK